jgi:hypothetical protein
MKPTVSLGKVIREMDSQELEDFLLNVWTFKFNKNTKSFLADYSPIIKQCEKCYSQLTNKSLLNQISKQFEKENA